jgi:ParB/RepB/Spo0J family partition protein
VQPIVVRRVDEGYELIAGERRWRAAQMAGLETIPAVVRDIPDQAAAAMALIENIQRENLNPLEEAQAIRRLIGEFEMTHQDAATAVGRSRTAVTNLLRLLDLHDAVKERVNARELEMGHARCLLALPMDRQPLAADQIVKSSVCPCAMPSAWSGGCWPNPQCGLPAVRARSPRSGSWRRVSPTPSARRFRSATTAPARVAWSSSTTAWTNSMASSRISTKPLPTVCPEPVEGLVPACSGSGARAG